MSFMAMTHIQNQLSAQSSDIVYYRESSYGTFATNASINYLFTQPQNVEMTGLLMDMDRMKSSAECKINCWEDWRDFNQQSGAAMSAYEHLIPEQLFSTEAEPVEGVSAVKALAIASSQGQRIYTFDQSNLLYLNDLTIEQAIKDEITVQVNVGFVATVHQHPITHAGWTGAGYTIVDPVTGSGAYKISGGANGGETSSLPEPVSDAIGALSLTLSLGVSILDAMFDGITGLPGTAINVLGHVLSFYQSFSNCSGGDVFVTLVPTIVMGIIWPLILSTLGLSIFVLIPLLVIISLFVQRATSELIENRC